MDEQTWFPFAFITVLVAVHFIGARIGRWAARRWPMADNGSSQDQGKDDST